MARNAAMADDVVAVIDDPARVCRGTSKRPWASCGDRGRPEAGGSAARSNTSARRCSPRDSCRRSATATSRFYDRTERFIGPDVAAIRIDRADAGSVLVARAAASPGVATPADADYYRMSRADTQRAIDDAVEEGMVREVTVGGWDGPAYLAADARTPRAVSVSTILSPFDPLVFFRPRALRLFGFHYRIEIYTPAHKRVHGYYVHPYLLGDDIAARVDLKADRSAGVLRVPAVHLEPGRDRDLVAEHLATDLTTMARWLGLDGVAIRGCG